MAGATATTVATTGVGGASVAEAGGSAPAEGWRITRGILDNQILYQEQMYQARCMRHARLLEAINTEISKLSCSISQIAEEGGGGGSSKSQLQLRHAAPNELMDDAAGDDVHDDTSSGNNMALQLHHIDQLVMIETKIALWNRLQEVIRTLCTAGGRRCLS